eukprot:COSAG03_NODE_2856_length_2399_cov_20.994348_1_plen_112_part_00
MVWLRQVGTLFDAFRGSTRALAKRENTPGMALYAESRFDAKQQKYTTSELEAKLDISAPGVYLGQLGAAPTQWTKCKTGHTKSAATVDDVKANILKCVDKASKGAEVRTDL